MNFTLTLILTILNVVVTKTDDLCGNWTSFSAEKCIKIVDKQNVYTFNEGIDLCGRTEDSRLLTITSELEQIFVEQFINNTIEMKELPVIGFLWNNSDLDNNSNCSQFVFNKNGFTEWINTSCSNRGFVICEKYINNSTKIISKMIESFRSLKPDQTQSLLEINNKLIHNDMQFDYKNLLNTIIMKLINDLNEAKNEMKELKSQLNSTQINQCSNIQHNGQQSSIKRFGKVDDQVSDQKLVKQIGFRFFRKFIENGKQKIMFLPINRLQDIKPNTFEESVNTCRSLNTHLIEVKTVEKQIFVEKFVKNINFLYNNLIKYDIWMNGRRDSFGNFRWISNGEEIKFFNWDRNEPDLRFDFLTMKVNDITGKWRTFGPKFNKYTVCEATIEEILLNKTM